MHVSVETRWAGVATTYAGTFGERCLSRPVFLVRFAIPRAIRCFRAMLALQAVATLATMFALSQRLAIARIQDQFNPAHR